MSNEPTCPLAAPLLPELIDMIADYWPGRGLFLTCARLAARADVRRHMRRTSEVINAPHREILLIESRLPDGTFHGMSQIIDIGGAVSENIYYDLGRITQVDWFKGAKLRRRDVLVNGYTGIWRAHLNDSADIFASGGASIKDFGEEISVDNFPTLVREWLDRERKGTHGPNITLCTYFEEIAGRLPCLTNVSALI